MTDERIPSSGKAALDRRGLPQASDPHLAPFFEMWLDTFIFHGRLDPSGRGLLLVEELATRWGHRGGPSGRIVWCELDCP